MESRGLLVPLEGVLASYTAGGMAGGAAGGVVEQCLCVLVNLSTCSEKIRNTLVHNESIISSISAILVRMHMQACICTHTHV